jgi:hypothetical protein
LDLYAAACELYADLGRLPAQYGYGKVTDDVRAAYNELLSQAKSAHPGNVAVRVLQPVPKPIILLDFVSSVGQLKEALASEREKRTRPAKS